MMQCAWPTVVLAANACGPHISNAQLKGKIQMSEIIQSIHSRSGESTRPDLTQEQEAEICGLTLTQVMVLWQAMERALPGPTSEIAWNNYVKATSVTLAEAAVMLGIQPVQMSHRARQGSIKAFQHRNRWRMWMAHLREMQLRAVSSDGKKQ